MKIIDTSIPIVIYGAGNCGRSTLLLLRERDYHVRGFLDCEKRGEVEGLPCFAPHQEQAVAWRNEGAVLVVGVWNFTVDLAQLGDELHDQGWPRVVLFPEICELWGAPIEPYWMTSKAFYLQHETQVAIEAASELWADEQSRRLFDTFIAARRTHDLRELNAIVHQSQVAPEDIGTQYFAPGIADWPSPKRFVDCGAFDGDTLRVLPPSVEIAAAFEPDEKNFQLLAQLAREERGVLPCPILLWPCGVWHETTQLSFSGGTGSSSRLSDEGEQKISVIALDDALPNFAPDMIKMDIEGAEEAALQGASVILARHRPVLAIAVYHRPEHLWSIALGLERNFGGYSFYLRTHALNGFETILYAVPN